MPLNSGDQLANKYRIEAEIGRGASAAKLPAQPRTALNRCHDCATQPPCLRRHLVDVSPAVRMCSPKPSQSLPRFQLLGRLTEQ